MRYVDPEGRGLDYELVYKLQNVSLIAKAEEQKYPKKAREDLLCQKTEDFPNQ